MVALSRDKILEALSNHRSSVIDERVLWIVEV